MLILSSVDVFMDVDEVHEENTAGFERFSFRQAFGVFICVSNGGVTLQRLVVPPVSDSRMAPKFYIDAADMHRDMDHLPIRHTFRSCAGRHVV